MKKRLLMLLSLFMAVTSVGWVHAADKVVDPAIFTDLGKAVVGKPIVFNVGTAKGTSTATNVRVKISLTGDNNPATLKDMGLMYFENGKWNVWNAESDEYWFGPTSGFPIKDLVSPILMKPTKIGKYNCKLEVVQNSGVLADTTFTVDVKETSSDLMIKSDTLYSTPNAYALSHGGYCAGLLMETNASIVNGKGIYSTLVYAGGLPVTVSAAGDKTQIKLTAASDSEAMVLDPKQSGISLFGGMKKASVENTLITMTGGTINNLVGGGRGTNGKAVPHIYADVNGSTTINIEGGNVGYLIPGGYECAKSGDITVTITGANTRIGNALCGGYAPVGMKGQDISTAFNESANRVNSTKLNMTGGTIYGYMFVGGGYSYSYSKEVEATFDGVTMNKGILGTGSNGRSDIVNITAKSCIFKKADGQADVIEIAPLNRGIVENATMTFDGCTFPNDTKDYFCYLGATYQYDGKSTVKLGNVTMSFKGETTNIPVVGLSSGLEKANVTLNGAKASVAPFASNSTTTVNAFTIGQNNTWNFNGGLTFEKEATLTNNGTLNIKGIDNVADLQSAVATGANSIGLQAGTYELPNHLLISKPMVIEGVFASKDSTIIKQASGWSGTDNGTKNLIRIDASNTTLKNLVVEGSTNASGIHVYRATDVTLDNVISRNNKAAGLIVNGSTVTGTNFRTSGNEWYGVNVDKGTGVESEPMFTIGTGCSFGEKIAIQSDIKEAPAGYVIGSGWFKTIQDEKSVWINGAATGLNFAITSVPASVIYGQANLPLLTNVDSAYYKADKVKISILDNNGVVKIIQAEGQPDSLEIVKPGDAVLVLAVGDTTVSQPLTVLKKTLTITGITTKARAYDGKTTVTLNTDNKDVDGLVGNHQIADVINDKITGEALSANAGIQPVKVTATLKDSYKDYYELAEITGVMDTITKVKLTYKANKPDAVNFGKIDPSKFAVALSSGSFVNSENVSVLGGSLQFDCPATNTSLAGKYPVMPYGYTSNNYEISYVADTLVVNAVKPTAEITSVIVNGVGENASISVYGRILSNGGTSTEKLQAEIKPVTSGTGTETTVNVQKDGTFKAEKITLTSAKYTVELTVKASESLSSEKVISGEVALGAKLQNVNFTSVPTRMTYGSKAGISAESTEADAKLVYTINGEAIKFNADSTEIEAIKAGEATVTITATKDEYVTAIAKQTIKVEPKLVTVTATADDKVYDGKLDAKVAFKADGILEKDASSVTLVATNVKGAFTDKNVSESAKTVVLSGECSLNGNSNNNYVLAQPANPTAKITKAKITAITASEVQRNYKATALSYKLNVEGLVDGETINTPGLYTGTISVKENPTGNFNVVATGVTFRNYDRSQATLGSGPITIIKGTPTIVTYNKEGENGALGRVVDNGGWESLGEPTIVNAQEDGKVFASLEYPNGTVTGNTIIENREAPKVTISLKENVTPAFYRSAQMTKADDLTLSYSEEKELNVTVTVTGTYTVESTTPSVLTVYKKEDNGSYYVKGTGVGTGAILIKVGEAVASKTIKVTPAILNVTTSGLIKKYDGTTTANVALVLDAAEGASLDLDGVSFNYADKNVGKGKDIYPSKNIVLKGANADNYKLETISLKGEIEQRTLTVTSQVSKYYDGTNTIDLTNYSATGLLTEEAAPIITATFTDDANVGLDKAISLKLKDANSNYILADNGNTSKGNISKSTLEAILPDKATDADNLKKTITYKIHETGETVKANDGINQYVTVTGSNPFHVTAADNENCVIIVNNKAVSKSDPVTPPDGGGDDQTVTIALNASSKILPRTEEFELTATVSPAGQTVTWSSSDPTIATVTANGNKATVKGIKVGKATITAKIGDVTATCLVTVDFATGIEEMLAQTEVYSQPGNIIVNPVQPLQLTIVNMTGQTVYNDYISGSTQIPARSGVYIVKLSNAGNTIISKLIVR